MADPRSRKTSEHNAQLVGLVADAVAMRAQIAALEKRVQRLEAELAASRVSVNKAPGAGPPPLPKGPQGAAATGAAPAIPRTAALPKMPAVAPAPAGATSARGSRRSVVDISEIAELVDSIPPPPSARPRK